MGYAAMLAFGLFVSSLAAIGVLLLAARRYLTPETRR
jgi:hypothetical protein